MPIYRRDGSTAPAYYHVWLCKKCGFKSTLTSKSSTAPGPSAFGCKASADGKHSYSHTVTKR